MQNLKQFSLGKPLTLIMVLVVSLALLYSCAPVFSELQSARLAGPGRIELTPSYSSVSASSEGETEHVQDHYGIQAAVGIASVLDFRVRYERVEVDVENSKPFGVNVLGFGPKFGLVKDWLALYLPVGFAFGEDIKVSETWQFHPTVLFSIPFNKYVELNTSAKALIPLQRDQDTLLAFNVGFGLSSNLDRWAIRPEIGFLYNPNSASKGHYMHLSIGFTYRFDTIGKR